MPAQIFVVMTVCVVDLGAGHGHHAHYLKLLVEAWREHGRDEVLAISVRRSLLDRHRDLALASDANVGINIVPLSVEAEAAVERSLSTTEVPMASVLPQGKPAASVSTLWQVAQSVASRFSARHLFLTDLDRLMPALAGHLPGACTVSGIWFQPRFHYRALSWPGAPATAFEAAEKWMVARALANPDLQNLLVLDPFAAARLADASQGGDKVRWLADPLARYPSADRNAARRRLDLADRFAVLHFGELSHRKGIVELVTACGMLKRSVADRIVLLLAGSMSDLDHSLIAALIDRARQAGCAVLDMPQFASDALAGDLFAGADLVSVAYARHAGMSGVLLSAAAHGRPVVAQADGLVGALTRQHNLGAVLPAGDPASVAKLLGCIVDAGKVGGFDAGQAVAFAERHDPAHFKKEVMRALAPRR